MQNLGTLGSLIQEFELDMIVTHIISARRGEKPSLRAKRQAREARRIAYLTFIDQLKAAPGVAQVLGGTWREWSSRVPDVALAKAWALQHQSEIYQFTRTSRRRHGFQFSRNTPACAALNRLLKVLQLRTELSRYSFEEKQVKWYSLKPFQLRSRFELEIPGITFVKRGDSRLNFIPEIMVLNDIE